MLITLSGIVMLARPVQFLNAESSIFVISFGIMTFLALPVLSIFTV